jgi:hypothetical protein
MRVPVLERDKALALLREAAKETVESLPQVASPIEARDALEDIAKEFKELPDPEFKDVVAKRLESAELQRKHAARFMKHADRAVLEGRAAMVRDAIREWFGFEPRIHDAKARKAIINTYSSTGTIAQRDFEELLGAALLKLKMNRSAEVLKGNFDRFMETPSSACAAILNYLSSAIDDSVGLDEFFVKEALFLLAHSEEPVMFADLPKVKRKDAPWAIHDIAREIANRLPGVSDDEFRQEVADGVTGLTKPDLKTFLKRLGGAEFAGRSAIVAEVLRDYAG